MTPRDAFASLNRMTGIAPLRTPNFEGDDPVASTPFRVATASAAAVTLAASTAGEIWRLRGGTQQDIAVDLRAATASLVSFGLLKLNGQSVPRASQEKPTVGFYRGACGRWIHLQGAFPHLERRTLDLLNAANTREAIAESVSKWSVLALEDALAYMGQCGAVVRTEEEWRQSPQGAALADVPPIVLKKIADAPVLRLPDSESPLEGVRILDLTRVLAGPVVARTLASHGAEVLGVRSETLPNDPLFDLDTGPGKRSAFLELTKPSEVERLRALARNAHVLVDSYRPGALAGLGITPAALAHASPGIIYVAVSCYGHQGPWVQRRGFEQMAQCATGLAADQGMFLAESAGQKRDPVPQLLPLAACDYITGYLAAAGAAAALAAPFPRRRKLGRAGFARLDRHVAPVAGEGSGSPCAANLEPDGRTRRAHAVMRDETGDARTAGTRRAHVEDAAEMAASAARTRHRSPAMDCAMRMGTECHRNRIR